MVPGSHTDTMSHGSHTYVKDFVLLVTQIKRTLGKKGVHRLSSPSQTKEVINKLFVI